MPELPEVETVRRGLAKYILGKTVHDIDVFDVRSLKKDSVKIFSNALKQSTITGINRRGKYLWLTLDDSDVVVLIHLGMSGQVLLETSSIPLHSHVRIRLKLNDKKRDMRFVDQRLFGGMQLDVLTGDVPTSIRHIAFDPFELKYDQKSVIRNVRKRSAGIKSLMLNQTIISGIGNIYADEALWQSKINYLTPGNRLQPQKLEELFNAAKMVMARAIDAGGTSFDDLYVNVNGESGWFEVDLNAYGREDEPCPRCGKLIVREPWANRSSYRCPRCQPKPRAPR